MGTKSENFLADFFDAGIQHGPKGAHGRDPRDLTAEQLAGLGHQPCSPLEALRATCLAHLGTAPRVRACTATACPAWPFRLGKHPYRKKIESSTEQKLERAARVALARQKKAEKQASKKNSPSGERTLTGRRGRGWRGG